MTGGGRNRRKLVVNVCYRPYEMRMMIVASVLTSALAYALSTGVVNLWPLAWMAPFPILWLALRVPGRQAAITAFVAYALGRIGNLPVILAIVPPHVVLWMTLAAAAFFAAKQGVVTVSDAYGRARLATPTSSAGVVLEVVSVVPGAGSTLYARSGDWFGHACVASSALLLIGLGVRVAREKVSARASRD